MGLAYTFDPEDTHEFRNSDIGREDIDRCCSVVAEGRFSLVGFTEQIGYFRISYGYSITDLEIPELQPYKSEMRIIIKRISS